MLDKLLDRYTDVECHAVSANNCVTSPRSCHRSFQILVFLDQSAKILFNLEHQARFSLRGKKKESCLKFKIKESWLFDQEKQEPGKNYKIFRISWSSDKTLEAEKKKDSYLIDKKNVSWGRCINHIYRWFWCLLYRLTIKNGLVYFLVPVHSNRPRLIWQYLPVMLDMHC
jgi:hypothetical protein